MHGALTFVAYVKEGRRGKRGEEGRGEEMGECRRGVEEKEPTQPTIHCCRVRCTVCGVLRAVCGARCAVCDVLCAQWLHVCICIYSSRCLLFLSSSPSSSPSSSGTTRHRRPATRPTCSSSGRSGERRRERKCVVWVRVCVSVCCGASGGCLAASYSLLQPRTASCSLVQPLLGSACTNTHSPVFSRLLQYHLLLRHGGPPPRHAHLTAAVPHAPQIARAQHPSDPRARRHVHYEPGKQSCCPGLGAGGGGCPVRPLLRDDGERHLLGPRGQLLHH